MKHLLLALIALTLTACGGVEVSPERPQTGNIVVIGDSITAGNGVEELQRYTNRLQAQLNNKGYGYQMVNLGVSGDRTDEALKRIDEVLEANPEIVIVQLGGNDFLQRKPVSEVESNLRQIISQIQTTKADVLLVGIVAPPTRGLGYPGAAKKMYQRVAEDLEVTLHPNILKGIFLNADHMQPDKIHPTSSGHRIIAENLWESLEEMLRD